MLDLVKENYKVLVLVIFFWMIISKFILIVFREIKNKIVLSSFYKNTYIKNVIYLFRYITLLFILLVLIDIQIEYKIIQISNEINPTTLVISLLTIYGILYTFIQFALGYSNQKQNDKYWGESVIEVLLNRGMEFTFFHSKYFKAILLYSTIYPLINWEKFSYIHPFQIYLLSFWEIAIVFIYLLYVLLFTKSLFIMRRLFLLEKRIDIDIKIFIQMKKEEKYQELFNYSIKNRNFLFIDVLFRETLSLENDERKEFFENILINVLYTYKFKFKFKRNLSDILSLYKFKQDKKRNKLYFMKQMFSYLFQHEKLPEIGLSFDELLIIYRVSEKIIYNELKLLTDNEEKFIETLVNLYKSRNSFRYEYELDNLPPIIWDAINSNEDIYNLYLEVENRDVEKYIYQQSKQSSNPSLNKLLANKKYYINKLLKQSKQFLKAFENKTSTFIFKNNDEKYINDIIYDYLLDLEFTEENKRYIKIIIENLNDFYKISFVLHVMLYTGEDVLKNRKQDVMFLKQITKNIYIEDITKSEIKMFVVDNMSKSGVNHRIGSELIETIFNNLKKQSTNKDFIQSSIDQAYLSYVTMVKIKFILKEDRFSYLDFSGIERHRIKQNKGQVDWKIDFIREMLITPSLLKESFFNKLFKEISDQILKENKMHVVHESDFRLFYLNYWFNLSEKEFNDIRSKKPGIGDGIFEFLILKLDEPDYAYLLTNKKLAIFFKEKIRPIIYQSNKNIEQYVYCLANQANELSKTPSISKLKIEIIIHKLTKLIYE